MCEQMHGLGAAPGAGLCARVWSVRLMRFLHTQCACVRFCGPMWLLPVKFHTPKRAGHPVTPSAHLSSARHASEAPSHGASRGRLEHIATPQSYTHKYTPTAILACSGPGWGTGEPPVASSLPLLGSYWGRAGYRRGRVWSWFNRERAPRDCYCGVHGHLPSSCAGQTARAGSEGLGPQDWGQAQASSLRWPAVSVWSSAVPPPSGAALRPCHPVQRLQRSPPPCPV